MIKLNENQSAEQNNLQPIRCKGTKMIVIVAILLTAAALTTCIFGSRDPVEYGLTIARVDTASLKIYTHSDDSEGIELELQIAEDALIQDVNGQIIDLSELSAEDIIRVQFAGEADEENPEVKVITLLPDDSNDFI